MARNRQPVDLLVAKGRAHLTKEQIEKRREQELVVPFTDAEPPQTLTRKEEREEFKRYADMLNTCGVMKTLDVDCLANYILARNAYWMYEKRLKPMRLTADVEDLQRMTNLQDKAFKQWLSCAKELGLTIISRAKIVVPKVENEEDFTL